MKRDYLIQSMSESIAYKSILFLRKSIPLEGKTTMFQKLIHYLYTYTRIVIISCFRICYERLVIDKKTTTAKHISGQQPNKGNKMVMPKSTSLLQAYYQHANNNSRNSLYYTVKKTILEKQTKRVKVKA